MIDRHEEEEAEQNSERWCLTYSDMITLLLVLFIMLYTMSTIDMKKYQELAKNMKSSLVGSSQNSGGAGDQAGIGDGSGTGTEESDDASGLSEDPNQAQGGGNAVVDVDKFSELFNILKSNVDKSDFGDKILIEKGDTFIHLRFKDTVLFYPDSTNIREECVKVLEFTGKTLTDYNDYFQAVQIEGHTADIGAQGKDNFKSWELSSLRALAVLETMVSNNGLDQRKLAIAGYSHFNPVGNNSTEDGKAINRRVEITITKVNETK